MSDITSTQAWDIYWQAGHQESFSSASDDPFSKQLRSTWIEIASSFNIDGIRILDMATGNGAVPLMLLQSTAPLNIVGVDKAAIKTAPLDHQLHQVEFLSGIDNANLPLASESFHLITSQFGFEYGDKANSLKEAFRVLHPGGKFHFILHHKNSQIVESNTKKLAEFAALMSPDGVVDAIVGYAKGELSANLLQEKLNQHMNNSIVAKTQQVTGQVSNAVAYFCSRSPSSALVQLAQPMQMRMTAEQSRIIQMQQAAISIDDVQDLQALAIDAGFLEVYCEELTCTDVLMGWSFSGGKSV